VKPFPSGHDSEIGPKDPPIPKNIPCFGELEAETDPSERSESFTVWRIGRPVAIFERVGEIKGNGSVRTLSGLHRVKLEMSQTGRSSRDGWERSPKHHSIRALAREP